MQFQVHKLWNCYAAYNEILHLLPNGMRMKINEVADFLIAAETVISLHSFHPECSVLQAGFFFL